MKKRFTQSGTSTRQNETSSSKLRLSRETLRYLSGRGLGRVAGDIESSLCDTWDTCYPTCVSTS